MDKQTLKQIREDMNAALAAVAKKHGLGRLEAAGCTFAGDAFTFKVEGVKEGGIDKEGRMYELVRSYDDKLPPLGTQFKAGANGVIIEKIVGATSTGRKIITQRADGKRYVWHIDALKQVLARQ